MAEQSFVVSAADGFKHSIRIRVVISRCSPRPVRVDKTSARNNVLLENSRETRAVKLVRACPTAHLLNIVDITYAGYIHGRLCVVEICVVSLRLLATNVLRVYIRPRFLVDLLSPHGVVCSGIVVVLCDPSIVL